MSIITDIVQQKRNRERYNIYIDYEYAFSLSGELVIEYKLKKNSKIEEEVIKELAYKENIKKAYNMALHYLKYRMRSQKEIEDYLVRKGFDQDIIMEVMGKLKEYDFVDDETFAKAMTRDLLASKLVGRRFIVHKLRQKGIADYIINSIKDQIEEEEEFARAYELAEKQFSRCKDIPSRKDEQRIARLMARRGFEWHMINSILREKRQKVEENI